MAEESVSESTGRLKICFVIPSLGAGGAEYSLGEFVARTPGFIDAEVVYFHHREEGIERDLSSNPDIRVTRLYSSHFLGRVHELRKIISQSQPDLVVSAVFEADMVARVARMGRFGSIGVSTIINSQYEPASMRANPTVAYWKLQVVRSVDAITARLARDYFHAITDATATSARNRLWLRPDRIRVAHRGRDRARLGEWSADRRKRTRARLGLSESRPLLLTVGRREFQKGHLDLIRSLPAVVSSIPNALLLIAGRSGGAALATDRLIHDLGLNDHVRVLGHRDDAPDLMVAADLFVFSSLWEGFGGVIAEAMALRLPIVSTDVPEVCEVLGTDSPGPAVIVLIGDSSAMSDAIVRVMSDPAERNIMGEVGHSRFESNFNLDAVAIRTLALYRDLASNWQAGTTDLGDE